MDEKDKYVSKEAIQSFLTKLKLDLEKLKKEISRNSELKVKIRNVYTPLRELEEYIGVIQAECSDKVTSINDAINKIREIEHDVIMGKLETIFAVIEQNLILEMRLESTVNDPKNIRYIFADTLPVGSLRINDIDDEHEEVVVDVEICNQRDKFLMDNTYKVYPIINFINTKYNYPEL